MSEQRRYEFLREQRDSRIAEDAVAARDAKECFKDSDFPLTDSSERGKVNP